MLGDYRKAKEWIDEHGGDVFPSYASFEWFVRRHRDELVRSQQYFPRKGSAGALVGPEIDHVVMRIMARECRDSGVCHEIA